MTRERRGGRREEGRGIIGYGHVWSVCNSVTRIIVNFISLHGAVQWLTVLYILQYTTIQYSSELYCTVYSTLQYITYCLSAPNLLI